MTASQNPDNPEAAALFHELNQASQILLDPIQRATFDKLLAARTAHKLRFAALDSKRKQMADELERSENEYKRRKGEERQQVNELHRLKEQSRLLRESKLKAQAQARGQGDVANDDRLDELKRRYAELGVVPEYNRRYVK